MRLVILLPVIGEKLLLTTPEIKILFTVRFDYLWVVFVYMCVCMCVIFETSLSNTF